MRNIVIASLVLSVAVLLSGCTNTADGFGKDLEKAGQNIQKKV